MHFKFTLKMRYTLGEFSKLCFYICSDMKKCTTTVDPTTLASFIGIKPPMRTWLGLQP